MSAGGRVKRRKSCILERHYTIGGLNFCRLNGRDFDVRLRAVTNFPAKVPLAPWPKSAQLRFKWEEFALSPQCGSRIAFPGVNLRFNNDIDLLRSQIHAAFPSQVDAFEVLLVQIGDYDDLDQDLFEQSTRQRLSQLFREPLLVEMLLCPLMWYGNAREHDMDWGQFSIRQYFSKDRRYQGPRFEKPVGDIAL
jgi:hypothetical protein